MTPHDIAEAGSIVGEFVELGVHHCSFSIPRSRICLWIVTGTVTTVVLWQIRASTLPEPGKDRALAGFSLCLSICHLGT